MYIYMQEPTILTGEKRHKNKSQTANLRFHLQYFDILSKLQILYIHKQGLIINKLQEKECINLC